MNKRTEYDEIPMTFCRDCLWHGETEKININNMTIEYCPYCGSTTFKTEPGYIWDELFRTKYRRPSYYKCKEKSWAEIIGSNLSKDDAELIIRCGDTWKDLEI